MKTFSKRSECGWILLAGVAGLLSTGAPAQTVTGILPPQSTWSKKMGDLANDSRTTVVGSQQGKLNWSGFMANAIAAPAEGANGSLYVSCVGRWLRAYSGQGELRWEHQFAGEVWTLPLVVPRLGPLSEIVCVGCDDGRLYAFTPGGSPLWEFQTGARVRSSPTCDSAGTTIYFGSDDGNLYAIRRSGTLKWSLPLGTAITATPAIHNRVLYVPNQDKTLFGSFSHRVG